MSHVMLIRATGGELYLAPIDKEKVQNVLDIGTGPGSCVSSFTEPDSGPLSRGADN